jgi:hypothetical protein
MGANKRAGRGGGHGKRSTASAASGEDVFLEEAFQAQRHARNLRLDLPIKVGVAALLVAALLVYQYGPYYMQWREGGGGDDIVLGEYEQKILRSLKDGSFKRKLKMAQERGLIPPGPPPPSGPFKANQV